MTPPTLFKKQAQDSSLCLGCLLLTIQVLDPAICPSILTCVGSVWQLCLNIPFIKGNVHRLTVLCLEVKHIEHEQGDHAAGCRPEGWLLKVLLCPASHTQTKTLHFLCQLTTWDVSLCWQRKRDPLLDRGGWVLVPALPLQFITPLSTTSSSSSTTQPPSLTKEGLPPSV